MSLLRRLARMPPDELAWRVCARARVEAQRVGWRLRRPRWRRTDLARVLVPDAVTPELRRAIAQSDWPQSDDLLRDRLRARPSRYVLDPERAAELVSAITRRWPGAAADAARRADRVLEGTYDLLGYRDLRCDDWHSDAVSGRRMPEVFWASVPYLDPQCGDHKVVWELNRHQHWLTLGRASWLTGEPRYSDALATQLESWLRANPPLTGVNWASMLELGFRSLSWVWAVHVLLATPSARSGVLVDLLVGLDRQLEHVAANLSHYFSPNTHLTGEALALYVAGRALPELARSTAWADTGRQVLLAEISRQVAPDGGHVERSMHYQRYTLDFYLLALAVALRTGDGAAVEPFRDACARLAACTGDLADDSGRLPNIGDDDGGMLWPLMGREPRDVRDSLAVAAALLGDPTLARGPIPEECWWIAGPDLSAAAEAAAATREGPSPARLSSTVLPQTGYAVVRSGGDHLVFDAGPHGYLNGGHAHADALSLTLSVEGRPLLIDPGTGVYTMDPVTRNRMRSSACHNTITLNGRSSSVPGGPFQWLTAADARLETWRGNAGFAWAEGAHDGYAPARHRRSVVTQRGAGWLIVDEIVGGGSHRADMHWHVDPAWSVRSEEGHRLRLETDGCRAWLVHEAAAVSLISGDDQSGLGWCSPIYGVRVPATTARVTATAMAPFARATWIGTGGTPPALDRVAVQCDAGGALGVRVRQDDCRWITVVVSGDAGPRETRGIATSEYHSDARLVQYGVRGNGFLSVALADVSHLLSLQDGLISIAADGAMPDVYVAIHGEDLEVVTTAPPPFLRLEGTPLAPIRRVRLNGREQPAISGASAGRIDVIEVFSTDWAPCVESPVLSI